MTGYRILLFTLLLVMLLSAGTAAESPAVILLIIDQTAPEELTAAGTEYLSSLQDKGAFGLMNVRTAGHLRPESTYLSAGNGNICKGSEESFTGENYGNKGIVNKEIEVLEQINSGGTYQPRIGLLGRLCRENDRKIALLGNIDTGTMARRTAVSLVMDEHGYIPLGDVSKDLVREVDTPWGYRTDWKTMRQKFQLYRDRADFLVIETGDMSRIEYSSGELTPRRLKKYRQESLRRIDRFTGYLLQNVNLRKTVLIITSLTPSRENIREGKRLGWLMMAGEDIEHGWLTSLTTRRTGIVTIVDLLPTVLELLGIKYKKTDIRGRPMTVNSGTAGWSELVRKGDKISLISRLRPPFIQGFIALQLAVVVLAIACIFRQKLYFSVILQYIFEYLLLGLFFTPLNFIVVSQFNFVVPVKYLLLLIVLTAGEVYLLCSLVQDRLKRVLVIASLLVGLVAFDLINNNLLIADSILGYSSIIGARYYGLGNEYMGLFIGAAIISLAGFVELGGIRRLGSTKIKRVLPVLYILLMVYFIGAPHLGANFGGTLTGLAAGAVTWLYLGDNRPGIRIYLLITAINILIVMGLMMLDYSELLGPKTHIGRVMEPLLNGNFIKLKNIIVRKAAMNIKLLRWTIWTRVLLAFLVYLVILFQHPVGKLKELLNRYSLLAAGFYGGLAGSIITLLVNDSGVVASATLLFFPLLTLLYLFQYLNYGQQRRN